MKYFVIILAALIIISLAAGFVLYEYALNPKSKLGLFKEDAETYLARLKPNFFDEGKYEDVYIKSSDGLRLHGILQTQPGVSRQNPPRWVIAVHGYVALAYEMGHRAGEFYARGYNFLAPDNRGHGASEGSYVGMGWHDRKDILLWINYLNENYPGCEIVLYGVSMGGATVMMTSGEELPPNVKVIIEDCGYTSVYDEFKYEANVLFHLPAFPILYIADMFTRIRAGYSFKEASSIEQVKKAKLPMLFLHGASDRFVPTEMVYQVFDAANVPKDILVIPGAAHAESFKIAPEVYWNKVFNFIDDNM